MKCVIQITIAFAPKYRRKVFYGEKRDGIGRMLRTLCEWKRGKIVGEEVCIDHIHMLVETRQNIPYRVLWDTYIRNTPGFDGGFLLCTENCSGHGGYVRCDEIARNFQTVGKLWLRKIWLRKIGNKERSGGW